MRGKVPGRQRVRAFLVRHRGGVMDAGALLAIGAFVLLVLLPILADTHNPPGVDIYYHLSHLDYMADEVRAGHGIPTWSPVLGLGYRYFINTGSTYPTGLYFLNLPLQLLTDHAETTYVTSLVLIFFVMGSGFYLGFRTRFGRPAAFAGSLVAVYGPYNFTAVVPQGRWPALMALAFLPAFLAAYMNLLDRPCRRSFTIAAATSGLALIAHPLVLYTTLVGAGVYTVIWGMWQRIPLRRVAVGASSVVAGALVFWVFIPTGLTAHFFSSLAREIGSSLPDLASEIGDKAAAIGADQRPAFAITPDSFTLALRGTNENYAGLGPLILTLLIPVLQPRRVTFALAAACLILYAFAFGNAGPFYSALPFVEGVAPRRFLHPVYLFQGILVATALQRWLGRLQDVHILTPGLPAHGGLMSGIGPAVAVAGVAATISLFLFEAVPMRSTLKPWSQAGPRSDAKSIADLSTGGRLVWQATRDFSLMFHSSRVAGVDTIWSNGEIDRAALEGFPAWGVSVMALENARFVATDEAYSLDMAAQLRNEGFQEVRRWATSLLFHNPRPPTYLQRPSRPVLLAGVSAGLYWPMILPEAVTTGSDLAALDPAYLRHFDAIVIGAYRASDLQRAEDVVNEFVRAGGVVFVEEGRLDGPNLWGIASERREVPRNLGVQPASGETVQLEEFSVAGGPFVGQFYPDAGTPVLEAVDLDTGDTVPLIQERRIGQGAVYHVCCNIGHHTYYTRDAQAVEVLRRFVADRVQLPDSLWPEPFEAWDVTWGDRSIRFSYSSPQDTAVVVSLRRDPAWKVTANGGEVRSASYGPVTIVDLPAGEHSVALTYRLPLVSGFDAFVNVAGLAVLVAALGPLWRFAAADGQTAQWWAVRAAGWIVAGARALRRDPLTPIARGDATIRVGLPRLTSTLLYAAAPGVEAVGFRIEPESPDNVLVSVTIEVENTSSGLVSFDVGGESAEIGTADGRTFRPIDSVSRSRPVADAGDRGALEGFAPLWGSVDLPPASAIKGRLVFEVPRDSRVAVFRWHPVEEAVRSFG